MINVLSFDPAVRNFGMVLLQFNNNWINDLTAIKLDTIENGILFCDIYKSIYKILYADTMDLCGGKKVKQTTEVYRISNLKTLVQKFKDRCNGIKINHVIVEYQMPKNDKSHAIMNCLIYEFGSSIVVMQAFRKNLNITIAGPIQDYLLKYSKAYDANKAHLHCAFKLYLKLTKQTTDNKTSNLKDVADAFFQAVAFCESEYK